MNNEEKILGLLEKMDSRQSKTEALLEKHSAMLEAQASTLQKLVNKVDNLESELTETKQHVILMENDNKQQFGALFDGYSMLMDYTKKIQLDVAEIKARQENQELSIKWLDSRTVKKTS